LKCDDKKVGFWNFEKKSLVVFFCAYKKI